MMIESSDQSRRGTAEISFRNLILKVEGWLQYIFSKWATILVISLIGALIGYVFSTIKKPVFVAVSTFVIEDTDKLNGMGQFAGLASIVGLDLSLNDAGGIFQGDNILELYKSNSMIEKTLLTEVDNQGKKEVLVNRYIEFNKLREKWAKRPELANLKFNPSRDSLDNPATTRLKDSVLSTIVKRVADDYLIIDKPDKRLNIIKAEVRAPDEFFAKAFDEQIVKNVNDFYIQTKTIKALQNVRLLQHKTDSIRLEMSGARYSAPASSSNERRIDLSGPLASIQRSQFSTQTNWAILSELVKNLELSKITLQKQMPLIQLIDRPKFPLDNDSIPPLTAAVIGFFTFGFLTIVWLWLKRLYLELKTEVV
jgi:hypothetical protein